MKEEFKILNVFPAYRISNFGRIQSRWQRISAYRGFNIIKEDIWRDLKPKDDGNGYLQVHLTDGKNRKTYRIHTLVAIYFLQKPHKKGLVIRHLDSNSKNNHIDNLAFGTYIENENDKIANGTWNTRRGGAKITTDQVRKIRLKLKEGVNQKKLAKEYNVSRPTITRIANYTIWKDDIRLN